MAKYDVDHACGHTVTHQLFGKTKDREYRIGRLGREDCPACEKAAFNANVAARAEEIRDAGANRGLPALAGTEKQVAWAETIRVKHLSDAGEDIRHREGKVAAVVDDPGRRADGERALGWLRSAFERLAAQSEARYWIDHRDAKGGELMRGFARGIRDEAAEGGAR